MAPNELSSLHECIAPEAQFFCTASCDQMMLHLWDICALAQITFVLAIVLSISWGRFKGSEMDMQINAVDMQVFHNFGKILSPQHLKALCSSAKDAKNMILLWFGCDSHDAKTSNWKNENINQANWCFASTGKTAGHHELIPCMQVKPWSVGGFKILNPFPKK